MLKNLLTTYDLKSVVKKRPNLFRLCGFEIRSKQDCHPFLPILVRRIANPAGRLADLKS